LILAIVHGVVWAARLVLNLPVSWFAPTHAVVQLALGVGLRRSSAVALRVGTILLQVGADALFTAPQVARAFREGMPAVVLLPPILGVTLRAVPFALLLLGKPGSARRRAAVALAAFQLIVEVVATIAGVVAAKGILPGRHR
jgi:hypothetical protein